MDFEQLCMIFTMQEPFYGILLSSMVRHPTHEIDTIGVRKSGNVFQLGYNPDFIKSLSLDSALMILKHECLHLAFNHFNLFDTPADTKSEGELRNIAEDLEINCYLDKNRVKELGGMLVESFNFQPFEGTMTYYGALQKMTQQKPRQSQGSNQQKPELNQGTGGVSQNPPTQKAQPSQSPQPSKEQQEGNGDEDEGAAGISGSQSNQQAEEDSLPEEITSKGERFDDHSMWPQSDSEAEKQMLQNMVDTMLVMAAEETEKSRGTIPGELAIRIENLRRKPKPVADWRRYCRRYLGNAFTELTKKSRRKPSRRFPDAAGNVHRRKSNLLIAIDTSGSVSMPEYQEFMGQIKTMKAVADFHVLECDATIEHEYDFKGIIPTELHGGGGTSFQPPVDYFLANQKKYDALIYFTDGYANVPKNTPKETLWIISSQGINDLSDFRKNHAKVIKIPPHNN